MVSIFYADGLEEIEAVTIADILRRAKIPMQTVGIGSRRIVGAHELVLETDITIDELDLTGMTAVVLPGGLGGVRGIEESDRAMAALRFALENGLYIGAICAAPTILGKRGWLDGKKAVCYPGMEKDMGKALVQTGQKAAVDGNIITGRAPGAAMEFALTLAEVLKDRDTAELVTRFLVYGR